MDKRGSHVGVILSFVIFVVFVIFVLLITQPALQNNQDKEYLVGYLNKKVTESTSGEYITSFIKISNLYVPASGTDCFIILNLYPAKESIIKNEKGVLISSYATPNQISVSWSDLRDKFFNIYYSEDFKGIGFSPGGNCVQLEEGSNYEVGITQKEEYIFENKIRELIENEDYESTKEEYNIPANNEFILSFKFQEGEIITTKEKTTSLEKFVQEFSVPYVDKEANIKYGILKVSVW